MISLPHRRSRALLTALVTISVPGALTLVGVAGHLRGIGTQSAASTQTLSSSLPTVHATVQEPVVHAHGKAVELLATAADAGESVPYQGVELISRWALSGTDTVLATVWHARHGNTVTKAAEAASVNSGTAQVSYDPFQQSPEGVFGVTKPLISLLTSHYVAVMGGTGSVAGRTAAIVNVTRPTGSLAARFWIDVQTSLPLRREDYDQNSHMISESMFIQLGLGNVILPVQTSPVATTNEAMAPAQIDRRSDLAISAPVQPDDDLAAQWAGAQVPTVLLSKLRETGWPLPDVLPGGLSLYAAAASEILNDPVVDLSYSDGLSEVSLFVQRGMLAPKLAGWQPAKVGNKVVYASSRGLTWSARGYVYTVMADAPPQTVAAAVGILPHDSSPGFWDRMGRGFQRLAGLVNPFH